MHQSEEKPWITWLVSGTAVALLLATIAGPVYLYFFVGQFDGPLTTDDEHWANFGSFIGGVAGPLLSLITVVLLLANLRVQSHQVDAIQQELLASQHLRLLDAWLSEIEQALRADITTGRPNAKMNLEFADMHVKNEKHRAGPQL
ncbi:hypothetical protein SD81_035810 [Tolypothrix campylonemoides VB511288]|nr:hypothetical protein SD81_035810 [Tolypothrix campylonemoides VB511288]